MRVAVNAEQLLYRSPGGIGRYTAQLLTVVPAAHPDCEMVPFTARHPRARVDAVLAAEGVAPAARERVSVQKLPTAVLYQAWVRFGRPQVTGLDGATVVHAPSLAVPPSSGRPLVVSVHDAAPELIPEAFTAWGRRFHRMGLAAAARRADLVITGSRSAAEEIAEHTPIAAERIRVVPYGVQPPAADAEADRTVAARGFGSRPYVLWVGSLEPRKGVGTLVAAMAELHRRGGHPDVQTVLAGYEGWLNESIVTPEDRAELGPSLHQLGRVGEAELWALYRNAGVFAFPSRHEGFGLPVVEAMSQGIPVVASDIPALREVAGDAAVLVEPGRPEKWADAIGALLDDDAARRRLAQAGIERSRMFSAEAMAAATYAVYQTVGS